LILAIGEGYDWLSTLMFARLDSCSIGDTQPFFIWVVDSLQLRIKSKIEKVNTGCRNSDNQNQAQSKSSETRTKILDPRNEH